MSRHFIFFCSCTNITISHSLSLSPCLSLWIPLSQVSACSQCNCFASLLGSNLWFCTSCSAELFSSSGFVLLGWSGILDLFLCPILDVHCVIFPLGLTRHDQTCSSKFDFDRSFGVKFWSFGDLFCLESYICFCMCFKCLRGLHMSVSLSCSVCFSGMSCSRSNFLLYLCRRLVSWVFQKLVCGLRCVDFVKQ